MLLVRMSIPELAARIKSALDRAPRSSLLVAGVAILSSAAFGLGLLEGKNGTQLRESIAQPASVAAVHTETASPSLAPKTLPKSTAASTTAPVGSGEVVASKTGTKYYLPTCGTVKRIKDANKVWFTSRAAAEAAGYQPAANCKGL